MTTPSRLTAADVARYFQEGQVLPASFLYDAEDGSPLKCMVLSEGLRITRPENEAITIEVRDALIQLADLVEFFKVVSSSLC